MWPFYCFALALAIARPRRRRPHLARIARSRQIKNVASIRIAFHLFISELTCRVATYVTLSIEFVRRFIALE